MFDLHKGDKVDLIGGGSYTWTGTTPEVDSFKEVYGVIVGVTERQFNLLLYRKFDHAPVDLGVVEPDMKHRSWLFNKKHVVPYRSTPPRGSELSRAYVDVPTKRLCSVTCGKVVDFFKTGEGKVRVLVELEDHLRTPELMYVEAPVKLVMEKDL